MEDRPSSWAAPLPRAWGDRVRALAMPALLVAVAALGVYRHVTLDQTSWQGASFGMFATYDSRPSRAVVIDVVADGERRRIAVPRALEDDAVELTVVPTDRGARSLARGVLAELASQGVTAVQVEVRRLVVDTEPKALRIRAETTARGAAP
ncbi:MAG: hypothetical protein ACRDYW_02230 [Acidimicrobiales bacterium]